MYKLGLQVEIIHKMLKITQQEWLNTVHWIELSQAKAVQESFYEPLKNSCYDKQKLKNEHIWAHVSTIYSEEAVRMSTKQNIFTAFKKFNEDQRTFTNKKRRILRNKREQILWWGGKIQKERAYIQKQNNKLLITSMNH